MHDYISFYKPNLPDIKLYEHYVRNVFKSTTLTNHGPYVEALERMLQEYLNVKHVILVSSCTIGLQIALQVFKETRVIQTVGTTPFSFVASSSSIIWQSLSPHYIDIQPNSVNIHSSDIEESEVDLIMPVQIFGYPLDAGFNQITKPTVIDGAHSFGVFKDGKSILSEGDISVVSFHATKFFHTVEGGAIITENNLLAKSIRKKRNFGFGHDKQIKELGINAKMSELHAAMGVSLFESLDSIISKNRIIYDGYLETIAQYSDYCFVLAIDNNVVYHYSYFPLVFFNAAIKEKFEKYMHKHGIEVRAYFSESLNTVFDSRTVCENSNSLSTRIVLLPLYASLSESDLLQIRSSIKQFFEQLS